jgi:hypothetical protein
LAEPSSLGSVWEALKNWEFPGADTTKAQPF